MNTSELYKKMYKKGEKYTVCGQIVVFTGSRKNIWFFESENGKYQYWMNVTGKLIKK